MKRIVFLVDMNAFFIMCETTRQPELMGHPAAVAGDPKKRTGIILTANYEARACGVRTAMTLREALERCPALSLVPPDHDLYAEKSREVMTLLSSYTPILEQNSIDEAWLDMTGSKWLFQTPVDAARQIQTQIRDELDLWCSIGIADNKFLSKMASEMKKPLGISELWSDDVSRKLWPMPVSAMHGVGTRTADKLIGMGIRTIGDLAAVDESFLVSCFGKSGKDLNRHARGIDEDPVVPRSFDTIKSVGRSITCASDLTALVDIQRVLMRLAYDVGKGVRKLNRLGQTIQLTIKFHDFETITRQVQIQPTQTTQDLYEAACRLLEKNWDFKRPIRLIGISLSHLIDDQAGQQISLLDVEKQRQHRHEPKEIDQTLDEIRARFGSDCVTFGKLLGSPENQDHQKKSND